MRTPVLSEACKPRLCNTQSVNCIARGLHGELSTAARATERERVFPNIYAIFYFCGRFLSPLYGRSASGTYVCGSAMDMYAGRIILLAFVSSSIR